MTVVGSIRFRRYAAPDRDAVVALNEWALRDAGVDPADIPGNDDLHDVETAYIEAGGTFLVGVVAAAERRGRQPQIASHRSLSTGDGVVVAMGGYLPSEAGYEDERTVPGGAELHRMRVAPSRQGEGHGRRLLDELERRARTDGFDPLLATTSRRQQRALELYPDAGYERVGTSTHGAFDLIHFEKTADV